MINLLVCLCVALCTSVWASSNRKSHAPDALQYQEPRWLSDEGLVGHTKRLGEIQPRVLKVSPNSKENQRLYEAYIHSNLGGLQSCWHQYYQSMEALPQGSHDARSEKTEVWDAAKITDRLSSDTYLIRRQASQYLFQHFAEHRELIHQLLEAEKKGKQRNWELRKNLEAVVSAHPLSQLEICTNVVQHQGMMALFNTIRPKGSAQFCADKKR